MLNPKILAIETATDACSCAILVNNQLFERHKIQARAHTDLLLPMIYSLLQETRLNLKELDAFAFGQGPGSFTGIRIACSLIQGLSFGLNKPVVPVSTLRALAQKAYREQHVSHIAASLDARMQEVYWGLYVADQHGIVQSYSAEKLQSSQTLQLPEGGWFWANGYPRALDIAWIAAAEYQLGHFVSAKEALPMYLRNEVVRK